MVMASTPSALIFLLSGRQRLACRALGETGEDGEGKNEIEQLVGVG